MLTLDHLSVIAPDLAEGVAHVRGCLGLEVPFGQRHPYMGTHNHLLRLGGATYLEIVALDPAGAPPPHRRWFGLDDQQAVRRDWDAGRRLRGWVARTDDMGAALRGREVIFGRAHALPPAAPAFDFAIPADGSLPMDGALPSLIDRRGRARPMEGMADGGARLLGLSLEHPEPETILAVLRALGMDHPPAVTHGTTCRWRARIETAAGVRELW